MAQVFLRNESNFELLLLLEFTLTVRDLVLLAGKSFIRTGEYLGDGGVLATDAYV